MKTLIITRVSTTSQELETQKADCIRFATSLNYSTSDITTIDAFGVSAIKENEEYELILKQVYDLLSTGEYDSIIAWEISRIARREEPFIKLKNYLLSHKIQLHILNPRLYLLNEDGTVNSGLELAISLFLTLSVQEMKNKKDRFARGKRRLAAEGKYVGGGFLPYGYTLDENRYFIINEEEAAVVRLIYRLYSTGQYSTHSLAQELIARGIERPAYLGHSKRPDYVWVTNILKEDYFCGRQKKPAIVSEELYDKCKAIRQRKLLYLGTSTPRINIASGIIRCPLCGSRYVHNRYYYQCINRNSRREGHCDNKLTIADEVLDPAAFLAAKILYKEEKEKDAPTLKTQIKEDIAILQSKIDSTLKEREKVDIKLHRLRILYVEDEIGEEEYKQRKERINTASLSLIDKVNTLNDQIDRLWEQYNDAGVVDDLDDYTYEQKRSLVLRYFNHITVEKPSPASSVVHIYFSYRGDTITNQITFAYYPFQRDHSKPNLFWVKGDDKETLGHFPKVKYRGNQTSYKTTRAYKESLKSAI